jgi:hypothetical protein
MVTVLSPASNPMSTLFGRPAHLGDRVLVLGQNHAEGVAESALSFLCGRKPAMLRKRQPPETPTEVFGMKPSRNTPLRVVELQILDDRAVEARSRFPIPAYCRCAPRRKSGSTMASMSATSMGMYSGRQPAITPLTAVAQIVAARLSGSSTPSIHRANGR